MNKLLKLTGVSVVAIMTAMGANAAGYTCEELIEYTSCNPGYFLRPLGGENNSCPEGYEYAKAWCMEDYGVVRRDGCSNDDEGQLYGEGCFRIDVLDDLNYGLEDSKYWGLALEELPEGVFIPGNTSSCNLCPAGFTCDGGVASITPCPAGFYCDGTGQTQPSGECNVGTYSIGGATKCTTCPTSGLTDANGNAVSVTTASVGSTSAGACFIDQNAEFKDNKGTYRYKSDCSFRIWELTSITQEKCEELGLQWAFDMYAEPACAVVLGTASEIAFDRMVDTEEKCNTMSEVEDNGLLKWIEGSKCRCEYGDLVINEGSSIWICVE